MSLHQEHQRLRYVLYKRRFAHQVIIDDESIRKGMSISQWCVDQELKIDRDWQLLCLGDKVVFFAHKADHAMLFKLTFA